MLCATCMKTEHANLPFHRIQAWKSGHGAFFKKVTLFEIGYTLHLGHEGRECPVGIGHPLVKELTILHTNGVHRVLISFCQCPGADREFLQLLDAKLFPGTEERPQKAFSFELLRHFQQFNLSSKTAAWDFHEALLRLSDGVLPHTVTVC